MATQLNTQILDPILREHVLPEVPKQFQERKGLYNWMMDGSGEEITSKGCKIPAYVRASASNAFRGEAGLFPTPSSPEDISMRVRYTRYRRAFEISGDAFRQIDSPDALIKGLSSHIARITNSAMKYMNQELHGDGSGVVAVIATSGISGNTLTFNATTGLASFGSFKILPNAVMNLINPATGAVRAGGGFSPITVVSVDRANRKATFDQMPSDAAAGDYLVYDGSYLRSMHGLIHHVDDGAGFYQGILRSDYDVLKSIVLDAGGFNITNALFSKLDLENWHYSELDTDDYQYIMPVAQRFNYELLGHTIREIEGIGERKYDGGFSEVSYNGHPFMIDVDCPRDRIYKLRRSSFQRFIAPKGDFRIFDDDGMVMRLIPAFNSNGVGTHMDAYRIYFTWEGEIGCTMPVANSLIKNLSFANAPIGELH